MNDCDCEFMLKCCSTIYKENITRCCKFFPSHLKKIIQSVVIILALFPNFSFFRRGKTPKNNACLHQVLRHPRKQKLIMEESQIKGNLLILSKSYLSC